jgi:hypothetical protein
MTALCSLAVGGVLVCASRMTVLKTAPASGNTRNIVAPASLAGHIDLKVEAHHLHQVSLGCTGIGDVFAFPPAAPLLAVFGRLLGRFDPPANPVW